MLNSDNINGIIEYLNDSNIVYELREVKNCFTDVIEEVPFIEKDVVIDCYVCKDIIETEKRFVDVRAIITNGKINMNSKSSGVCSNCK